MIKAPDKTPGPGAYQPEKHDDPSKKRITSCSIGIKHKSMEFNPNPVAPNQYNVENSLGKKSFSSKVKNSPSFKLNCEIN
jgi:hypothetical protein